MRVPERLPVAREAGWRAERAFTGGRDRRSAGKTARLIEGYSEGRPGDKTVIVAAPIGELETLPGVRYCALEESPIPGNWRRLLYGHCSEVREAMSVARAALPRLLPYRAPQVVPYAPGRVPFPEGGVIPAPTAILA